MQEIEEIEEKICKTCTYYEPIWPVFFNLGYCHRHPPWATFNLVQGFALVREDNWCMYWHTRTGKILEKRICGDCKYWEPNTINLQSTHYSICNRGKPNDDIFPMVSRTSWCGEWQHKEKQKKGRNKKKLVEEHRCINCTYYAPITTHPGADIPRLQQLYHDAFGDGICDKTPEKVVGNRVNYYDWCNEWKLKIPKRVNIKKD